MNEITVQSKPDEVLAYSVRQVANMLNCSPNTIYGLVRDKKLPSIQLSTKERQTIRIPRVAVDELVAQSINAIKE